MPFVRSMSSDDNELISKSKRHKKASDMYVIEEHGTHNFFMAKLYCLHDQTNITTDESTSYFDYAVDDSSTDQSFESDANCFGGIRLQHSQMHSDFTEMERNSVNNQFKHR